jgi:phage shock protein C
MNSHYALDKANAKLLGVCAGFARWVDVDVTLTRATLVLLTLFLGPVALLAYLVTATCSSSYSAKAGAEGRPEGANPPQRRPRR